MQMYFDGLNRHYVFLSETDLNFFFALYRFHMIMLFAGLTDLVLKKEVLPARLKKSLQVAIELSATRVLSMFCCWINILKIILYFAFFTSWEAF